MIRITSSEMRRMNREKIFRLIYDKRGITRADIARRLGMSLPTVNQNLKDLEDLHLIHDAGVSESTGGRKPRVITCVNTVRVSVGVEIARDKLNLVAVDIYGEMLRQKDMTLTFENTDKYYKEFGKKVIAFCNSLSVPLEHVLGVGIAIQGTPSPDGLQVRHGKILLMTGQSLENFSRYLQLPCRLIHDVKAAALAELWSSRDIRNAVFLSLGQYLGGMLIWDRNIVDERQLYGMELLGGFIEHMTLHPGGEECYCGRKGCFSAYCSASNLLAGSRQGLPQFFAKVRAKDPAAGRKWKAFLDNLAIAAGSMHMMVASEIILGGSLATFFEKEDMEYLRGKIHGCSDCPPDEFFVRSGKANGNAVASGAALPFIEQFLASLD